MQRLAILVGTTALLWILPANAGEKISGINKDFQTLSELKATIPDQSGHSFTQSTFVFKSTASNPEWGDYWNDAVEQDDAVGTDIVFKGYSTGHFSNGDVMYFSYEGTRKITPKDGGAFDVASQGKFTWLGGTGKHNVKGPGTFACKFTQVGGTCDWQGDAGM